ncbi:FGGY-family carbohydrate kinase [Paenibacillus xerothermodurans]|uniref:Carbohydrate kinase n=1 Tax=Paenibacillus xerothermodurans TaxID=1977292 RepID=A0A2W1P562_PAEXE|nr:FGGY-family carbohydrate kinase [Paenibacillus xerothermodurans]PZE22792.1 hypothetical protein CBW46_003250 [Paenibacillus xerothermodurans]
MNCIVTLDVGTTHIKGYLFQLDGRKLNQVICPTSYLKQECGISEIDPDQVLSSISTILKALLHGGPTVTAVDAIVISGMACSFIPVDRQGQPLYPCVCWNDQRSARTVELSDFHDMHHLFQQHPLPMYLPFRIQWFFENNPQIASETYKWLNLTDYVLYHLSEQKKFITDYSQASRTMLFNSLTKEWNSALTDHFNLSIEQLPAPRPSGSRIGPLDKRYRQGAAYSNTQLILGGHDHMFAALAGGTHDKSSALNSTGTSEALVVPYLNNPALSFFNDECNLESHVIDNELFIVGYVASTGKIMEWANQLFHLFKWEQRSDFGALWKEHLRRLPLFIPWGRRMQPSRTGHFINIESQHNEVDFSLGVLEGIALETRALLHHLNTKLNLQTDLVRLVGGSSKSVNFLQMKSTIMNKPIEVIHGVDMTSLGGFILSGLALKKFSDVNQAAARVLHHQKKILLEPDIEVASHYETRYQLYLQERGTS